MRPLQMREEQEGIRSSDPVPAEPRTAGLGDPGSATDEGDQDKMAGRRQGVEQPGGNRVVGETGSYCAELEADAQQVGR